jgi:2,3-bisphosphoglycerate-independent phosphoglycerate mutase
LRNPVLLKVIGEMKRTGQRLHLMGLLSDGGVHSHITHTEALLEAAKRGGLATEQVVVHAIMDGRDTPPRSGAGYLAQLEQAMQRLGIGRIGTVIGRYYSMDRDNRWERTQRAYRAYVLGEGAHATSAADAIQASYAHDVTDEFVEPTVIVDGDQPVGLIQDRDAVVFFNFRPDRARQITRAFIQGACEPKVNVHYVCMTQYDATFRCPVAYPPDSVECRWARLWRAGSRQLRITGAEKYAHVTYFFNGDARRFSNEDRALIRRPGYHV